jgi:predicted PurR-regulated permease PerM
MADPKASPAQVAARIVLAALLVGLGFWTLHRYITALVWAPILAIAVWPLYRRAATRWPPGRANILWPSVFTAAVALLFVIPLIVVAVQAVHEIHEVYAAIGVARSEGIPPPAWVGNLPLGREAATAWWQNNLADPDNARVLLQRAQPVELVTSSGELGVNIAHRAGIFLFTLLTLFFLFRDGDRLTEQMRRASNRAFGPAGERIGRQMVNSVRGTVDGLVLVGLGVGFVMGIGYGIAGVPHPTLFGLFTAIAAMIPLAAPVVFGAASVALLLDGFVIWAVGIFAMGIVVTTIADHVIRPGLIGSATRLPFLWVLLGILSGVETWGLLGLFLGPAVMAALIMLWREWTGQNGAD